METIQDQGIVLRQWDFSETSQTAALLARGHGVIRCLAKGSRRDKAPFSGGLEVLTGGHIVALSRPNSELALLTEWDLQTVFWAARRGLGAYYIGLYMVDTTYHAVTDSDPHPNLFDALHRSLTRLDDHDRLALTTTAFLLVLLRETGYRPRLACDDLRGKTLGFSASGGGVMPDPGGGNGREGSWRVRRETIDALARLDELPGLGAFDAENEDPDTLARAARLLGVYLDRVLSRELPTREPAMMGLNLG